VKDDVREHRAQAQEMFVPLTHPPGHAQADFGEAVAVIGGVRQKIHFFCLDLPRSDAGFVKAYPAERIEAFLDGHNAAFAVLGGVPQSILYDNTRLAVARILGDGTRQRTRSYGREEFVFDPLHYLALLEQKIGALDQAAPLQGWELPEAFGTLRRLLEARMGKVGKREYVQILRLLESFRLADVEAGVHQALRLGAIGFDAIKHLVLCQIEHRPAKLDLTLYPYLPRAQVATTSAKAYMGLPGGAVS
jgi:hypothetical protein